MNKRIKKKKKTQENKLLHKICKDIKRICNNYTFHYSSVPDSEKFSDLIEAFEKIKSRAETLEKHYTTSSDITNIYDPSITVTLPESDLKVEILKDRHSPYVSWKGIPVDLPDINVSTQDTIEEIKKEIRDSINYILDAPTKKEEK